MTHLPLPGRDQRLLEREREHYSTRKDVLEIRAALERVVSDKDRYFSLMSNFIHGQCTKNRFQKEVLELLQTNEARVLHNKLIRAIIYNAHFSTVPPPGVSLPPPEFRPTTQIQPIPTVRICQNAHFSTFTAADLGHLQSGEQLTNRVTLLMMGRSPRIPVDEEAVTQLHLNLIKYIGLILKRGLDAANITRPATLRVHHILHMIKEDSLCSAVTSTALLTKYQYAS